jgi:hypothetical protein
MSDLWNMGTLTFPEFALAMYLTSVKVAGRELQVAEKIRNEVQATVFRMHPEMMQQANAGQSFPQQPQQQAFGGLASMSFDMQASMDFGMQQQQPPSYMAQAQPQQSMFASMATPQPQQPMYGYQAQPMFVPQSSMPMHAQQANVSWAVTPEEKASHDQVFRAWDPQGTGFMSGDKAREIFRQSGLPQQALAQIWSLADIHNQGKLNSDEFAVAMHLIHRTLAGQPIPTMLTPDLIPPSTRGLSDTVNQMKGSLVQDIMSKKYQGSTYQPRPQSGGERERFDTRRGEDWEGIYRPPRFGDVRKVSEWEGDEMLDSEFGGYRSEQRRKVPVRGDNAKPDHWGNLRGTADKYKDTLPTPTGARPGRREMSENIAAQEMIRRWRKELGEQRVLLETASYEAGDSSLAYATESELRARVQMETIKERIRELEDKIDRAEGGGGVDWSNGNKDTKERLAIEAPRGDWKEESAASGHYGRYNASPSQSRPSEREDRPRYEREERPRYEREPSPPRQRAPRDDYAPREEYSRPREEYSRPREEYRPERSPEPTSRATPRQEEYKPAPVRQEVSSPPVSTGPPGETEKEKIKRKATERLSQRMSMLTGKTVTSIVSEPPPVPTLPKVPEPETVSAGPSTSDLLAQASSKEERLKILQDIADQRMKERERFLKETGGILPTREVPKPPPSPPVPSSENNPFRKLEPVKAEPTPVSFEDAFAIRPTATAAPAYSNPIEQDRDSAYDFTKEYQSVQQGARAARDYAVNREQQAVDGARERMEKLKLQQEEEEKRIQSQLERMRAREEEEERKRQEMLDLQEAGRLARERAKQMLTSSSTTAKPTTDYGLPSGGNVKGLAASLFPTGLPGASADFSPSPKPAEPIEAATTPMRAVFSFQATGDDELSFDEGTIVNIVPGKTDESGDWFFGKLANGKEGWFPKAYVSSPDTAQRVAHVQQARALYAYVPQAEDELELAPDDIVDLLEQLDADWWNARNQQGQTGVVPAGYIELLDTASARK